MFAFHTATPPNVEHRATLQIRQKSEEERLHRCLVTVVRELRSPARDVPSDQRMVNSLLVLASTPNLDTLVKSYDWLRSHVPPMTEGETDVAWQRLAPFLGELLFDTQRP